MQKSGARRKHTPWSVFTNLLPNTDQNKCNWANYPPGNYTYRCFRLCFLFNCPKFFSKSYDVKITPWFLLHWQDADEVGKDFFCGSPPVRPYNPHNPTILPPPFFINLPPPGFVLRVQAASSATRTPDFREDSLTVREKEVNWGSALLWRSSSVLTWVQLFWFLYRVINCVILLLEYCKC